MQHSLAAIRAGQPRTRFTTPASRNRLPRLGLYRPTFAPVARPSVRSSRCPRDELRRATRACVTVSPAAGGAPLVRPGLQLRAGARRVVWSRRVEGGLRQARPRSPAPWQG